MVFATSVPDAADVARLATRSVPDDVAMAALLGRFAEVIGEIGVRGESMTRGATTTATTANAQLDRLVEIGRLGEEAGQASRRNRELAEATVAQVARAAAVCDEGGAAIAASVERLRQISASASRPSELLDSVLASATDVRRAVGQVAELATQTKMLSINAAIEAMHAGEKGSGFKVVAGAVKALADRSHATAERISALVDTMDEVTRSAVAAVGRNATSVRDALVHAESLQQKLFGLIGDMRGAKAQSDQVSEAAGRQIESLASIVRHGTEVQGACRDCAATADGTAEMIAGVLACAARMRDLAEAMAAASGVAPPAVQLEEHDAWRARVARLSGKVEAARQLFIASTGRLGTVALGRAVKVGGLTAADLTFGGRGQANVTSLVDSIEAAHGCSATLFVREGEGLVRIATSVRRGDGTRAVGTRLNPHGVAAPHLLAGRPYVGPVFILGRPFLAAYDPIVDAEGQVLGAWYVGHKLV